jgi:hypothetical protein
MVLRHEDGSPGVEYLPVKITHWPPGERVYGRPHEPLKEEAAGQEAKQSIPARRAS